jgi:hypothetical protein
LSGRDLRDELITRPGESYRLWCVVVCDIETTRIGAKYIYIYIYIYDISHLRVNESNLYKLPKRFIVLKPNSSALIDFGA